MLAPDKLGCVIAVHSVFLPVKRKLAHYCGGRRFLISYHVRLDELVTFKTAPDSCIDTSKLLGMLTRRK